MSYGIGKKKIRKYLSEGECLNLIIECYSELGQNVTDVSFAKTKLKMFDTNYTVEQELIDAAIEEEENENTIFNELEQQVNFCLSNKTKKI